MARGKSLKNLKVANFLRAFGAQFRGLDTRDPSSWPLAARCTLLAALAAVVVALLWFVWLKNTAAALQTAHAREAALRTAYRGKVQKAVSLDALRSQRAQVMADITRLEQQLPGKSEMDALLSDINQAGLKRNLQFELFRPGQPSVKPYYAELPIALRVSGNYHDIGAFAADIAHLPRIVTLNDMAVTPLTPDGKNETLVLNATAKTFRYLDADELAAQRKAAAPAGAKQP
jgi:type IV pilus assembly protein PilO